MAIINLDQGSKEWLEWRKSHVTATDISIILGSNPFKTEMELWEEKLGFRESQEMNDAMKRGQLLEPDARKMASELFDINFEPVVIESDEYPWLGASLDGISKCGKYILEIKCPKAATHDDAMDGRFPIYYEDQIQTQLLVSGAEICYYFSYRPECAHKTYSIIEVYPDPEKHEEILKKGYEFYVNMCTMNPPEQWKLKIKE